MKASETMRFGNESVLRPKGLDSYVLVTHVAYVRSQADIALQCYNDVIYHLLLLPFINYSVLT